MVDAVKKRFGNAEIGSDLQQFMIPIGKRISEGGTIEEKDQVVRL